MNKKVAVIILFLAVGLGLFYLKKNFNIQSGNKTTDTTVLTWDYYPKKITLETPVEFVFNLKDKDSNNISKAKIEIEANMNHSGMVPVFTEAKYLEGPTYKSTFKLTMHGEWILFLTITLPDGKVVKKEVKFSTN